MTKKSNVFKLSMLCSAILASTNCVHAQEEAKVATEQEIEIIMVTAQKRVQRIIDVPTSIVSVNTDAIEKSGSQQLGDIEDLVPNLTIEDQNSLNNSIAIRGVGAHSRNISFDTRVGVYLDGVYLGQSPGLNQDLMDIQRVEVLRGPQGSLFGKNTVAGAINILTKRPHDTFEGKVKARIGNYNAQQFTGFVNAPLADDIFFKVSANSNKRDGYIENLHPDALIDIGNKNSTNYRAQLLVESFANLELLLTVDGANADEAPFFGEHVTNAVGSAPVEAEAAPIRTTYTNVVPTEDRSASGISLEAIYELESGASVKSITAKRNTELGTRTDLDYSSLDFFELDYFDEYDQFTQEFQYTSPNNDTFEYIVGAYYYQQEAYTNRAAIPGNRAVVTGVLDATLFAPTLAAFGLTTFVGTPFESQYPQTVSNEGIIDTKSYALFSNFTYKFGEDWQVGLGLRWGKETKTADWSVDGSISGAFNIATADYNNEKSDNNFLPSLSLNYDVNSNLVAYARIATGSKSGGFNLDFVTEDQIEALEFDKETSTNFELGLKGYSNDGSLRYSITAFTTEYDDYQQSQFVDIGDGKTILSISNAATVKTSGVELELSADITDNFTVGFSAGLLSAKFDTFVNGGTADDPDVSGKRLPNSAEFEAVLSLDYSAEFGEGTWFAHTDLSYTGDMFTTPNNVKTHYMAATGTDVEFGYLPSRTLLNASVGVNFDTWSMSLWARNLADSDNATWSRRQFFGGIDYSYGAPRTVGIEATYKF